MTIADVAFDAPVAHSFSYRVPEGWALAPGQRAIAPLRGASRVGMVVALRDGADARLKPLVRLVSEEVQELAEVLTHRTARSSSAANRGATSIKPTS